MKLTKYEKETIILFNDAEDMAEVYTCNNALMRRLDELSQNNTEISVSEENENGKTYNLPKKLITIRKPYKITEKISKKREYNARTVLH